MLNCHFKHFVDLKEKKFSLQEQKRTSFILFCDGEFYQKQAVFSYLNQLTEGRLKRAIECSPDFTGKEGQSLYFSALSDEVAYLHLIGCKNSEGGEALGGAAYGALAKVKSTEALLFVPNSLKEDTHSIAQGFVLKSYVFEHYQTKKPKKSFLKDAYFLFETEGGSEDFIKKTAQMWEEEGKSLCKAVFFARDLVNEPANILTPETYKQRIQELNYKNLEIEILDKEHMEKEGFGALLGVAQGSDVAPYTVIMRYNGAPNQEEAPLAFIGKGVTFDSGGISIKPAAGMDEMKADMGGSAAVVGLISALAGRKAKINVIGVVGLVENMVSGRAQRPGDIVKSHSGQTIEVLNTDAEGRLVLADLLSYTKQTYQPKLMVNLATLTGAIIVALGTDYAGLFSNHDGLAEQLLEAGQKVHEPLWRMPLGENYNRQLNSDIADMKNIGGRPGSSILAAEFLKRFVGETHWAHLDIAGTAWKSKASAFSPKGATGYGVRLLNSFVKEYEKRDHS